MNFLGNLEACAEYFYSKGHYSDAKIMAEIWLRHNNGTFDPEPMTQNLKLCHINMGDFHGMLEIILKQKQRTTCPNSLDQEHANCLRYLGRYAESRAVSESQADISKRCLDVSWYLHQQGLVREAFAMTEQGRPELGWTALEFQDHMVRWRGQPVSDLVLIEEAGDGDAMIFSRWIPLLQKHCDRIWYAGSSSLGKVFERVFGVRTLTSWDQIPRQCPAIPVMSLAHQLDIDKLDNAPYLQADLGWINHVSHSVPKRQTRLGICWSGKKTHAENMPRSVPRDDLIFCLHDLGEILNLQQGETAPDPVINVDIQSWEHTLALIHSCDAVISVDTSVAHAAAALGKPTVVLTNKACYYTWNPTLDLAASVWYSKAWSVTQTVPGCWQDVLVRARQQVIGILQNQFDTMY
jgi:hypothetical protein